MSHKTESEFWVASVTCVAVGALILLVPALLSGRPFIYYDTWEFYSWGRDVLAAISNPWPAEGPFPNGRNLWASQAVARPPAIVDETQFRLTLSQIGARSVFYAVPLYLLRSLWVAAAAQALIVSWTLWVAVRAFGWQHRRLSFLATVVALTGATTLPFFTAFMMPDLFTGLAVLAAGLVVFFPDRIPAFSRWGLLALIAYATVAHSSNIPLVAAAIPIGAVLIGLTTSTRVAIRRTAPVAGAFAAGLVVLALGAQGMKAVFARPVQNPPFVLGRVIVDGPGLAYLQENCKTIAYVSCELTNASLPRTEMFMWALADNFERVPFSPWSDPDQRERFYAEQWEIVLGAIRRDPWGQLAASLRNAAKQLVIFTLRSEMNDALVSVLHKNNHRTSVTASITPNAEVCQTNRGQQCNGFLHGRLWKLLHMWLYTVVAASTALLAYRIAPAMMSRDRRSALKPEHTFALFTGLLVIANAVICGIISGPYDRYQARIVWLIPLVAVVLESRCGILRSMARSRMSKSPSLSGIVPHSLEVAQPPTKASVENGGTNAAVA